MVPLGHPGGGHHHMHGAPHSIQALPNAASNQNKNVNLLKAEIVS